MLLAMLAALASGGDPPPPLPTLPPMRTCAAGSPAAGMPFCNASSGSFEQRASSLSAALTEDERISLWALHSYHYPVPRLNIKGLHRDSGCNHGLALAYMDGAWSVEPKYVSVFPHAINHGASWDLELVARLANATGIEARAVSQIRYRASGGQAFAAVACDSGPLANTAHHPAWGRIAETYSEDPFLVSRMSVTATATMQARSEAGALRMALTTRHYLGYHSTNTMPIPTMEVSERDLHDAYLPGYRALNTPAPLGGGGAEAIMCGFASVNGQPSCGNKKLLQGLLRDEWASDSVVQSDCCDSITSIKSAHNATGTMEEAVAMAMAAGTQMCFGCDPHLSRGHSKKAASHLKKALAMGLVPPEALDQAVARIMLTRFRLGEFDEPAQAGGPSAWAPVDEALLDSAAHRALAREAAAASAVLVLNRCASEGHDCVLPVLKLGDETAEADVAAPHRGAVRTVALLGPFANCSMPSSPSWQQTDCYLHSYAGIPSSVTSILQAVGSDAERLGAELLFEPGTADTHHLGPTAISDAVAAAAKADLVLLALGLGDHVENESLDRSTLGLPPPQEELLRAVRAGSAAKIVVVCVSAGPVVIDPSLADALLYAGYGGEEAGSGIADVIFGRVSPSARLPLTVYAEGYLGQVGPISDFSSTSGVGRTYRYLDTKRSAPLWQFGYGLSYSRFRYTELNVSRSAAEARTAAVLVSATVSNVGGVDASEVSQLYVSVPGAGATAPLPIPLRSLQGFVKTRLRAGASARLTFRLEPSQYATVTEDGTAVVTDGTYTVSVGGHQPGDAAGEAVSNVLSATFVVPASEA